MIPLGYVLGLDGGIPDIPLAHDWWGIASLAIICLFVVGGGLLYLLIRSDLKAVKHEVKNSHETNLRDDLDEKFASVEGKQDLILSMLEDHGDRINSIEGHLRKG